MGCVSPYALSIPLQFGQFSVINGNLCFGSRVWVLNMKLIDWIMFLHSYTHVSEFNFNFRSLIRKAPNLEVDLTPMSCYGICGVYGLTMVLSRN